MKLWQRCSCYTASMIDPADINAVVTVDIDAPIEKVWDVLTKPELISKYMHGTLATTSWNVGALITWEGEWQGKTYQDRGEILAFDPLKRLAYTHWSSMGGSEDKPENYHTVTITLDENGATTTLTLTQGNNPTQEAADKMAQNAWLPMMQELKKSQKAFRSTAAIIGASWISLARQLFSDVVVDKWLIATTRVGIVTAGKNWQIAIEIFVQDQPENVNGIG